MSASSQHPAACLSDGLLQRPFGGKHLKSKLSGISVFIEKQGEPFEERT